jgi:hypothetical protein
MSKAPFVSAEDYNKRREQMEGEPQGNERLPSHIGRSPVGPPAKPEAGPTPAPMASYGSEPAQAGFSYMDAHGKVDVAARPGQPKHPITKDEMRELFNEVFGSA